jgi:D-aminopeptidase
MRDLEATGREKNQEDGSIMIVVATNAPLNAKSLERLSMRSMMGLARTGSFASNGSGDYVIAFSTDPGVRRPRESDAPINTPSLVNASMSPLFAAAAEATEEAIYNAILKATTVSSSRGTREAIPVDDVVRVLEKYNALNWDESISPGNTNN